MDDNKCKILADIHKQCFDKFWTAEEFHTLLDSHYNKVIVACKDECSEGKVRGFLLYQQVDEKESEIITVCVLPEYRRQGIAEHLIKQMKAEKIFLEVAEDNLPAVALYEKLGFRTTNIREKYYNNTTNALIMEKNDFTDWIE